MKKKTQTFKWGELIFLVSLLSLILSGLFFYWQTGIFSKEALGYEPINGRYTFDGVTGTQTTIVNNNRYVDATNQNKYVVALDYGTDVSKNNSILELKSSILLINSIDTLVVGSLNLTGGSIAIANGASIVLGKPVWLKDNDMDGVPTDLKAYVGALPIPSDINKNIRVYNEAANTLTADCNDADPVLNVTVNGYWDSDGDGYGSGSLVACATSATGYVANNKDCNDANASIKSAVVSGGVITNVGNDYYHTFKTNGTFAITCPTNLDMSVLLVGGGGGAGWENTDTTRGGGAGGGGGLVYIPTYTLSAGSYGIVIGTGGKAATATTEKGGNGTNTTFGALTALGGGGAGSRDTRDGSNGGSGGGGGRYDSLVGAAGSGTQSSQAGDSGTYGYGYNGSSNQGGGGGAGGAASGATGGLGKSVFGVTYSAGGSWNSNGDSGSANTGNGGNACKSDGTNCQKGGQGGSGIVVVKYTMP